MVKKLILLFLCVDILVLSGVYIQELYTIYHPAKSNGTAVEIELPGGPSTIQLRHRPFTVFEFPAKKTPPSALILFGSGDGGWGSFEERVCQELQSKGYTVFGIDSADYAKTDYDLATIQADYSTIVQKGLDAYKTDVPVIIGGWSMGAAQAVAACGGPNPPPGLVGMLLVSPCSRGRYGLRVSDRLEVLPTGPGTFALSDFVYRLNDIRIAQWHAGNDTIDSTAWLADLRTAHREYDFPNVWHDFGGAIPEFLDQLAGSVAWILNPSAPSQ